jgi:YgiT-type zinc finger domain-containing protein
MIKKCSFCGNKNFKTLNVSYILRKSSRIFIMNDVPCEQCEYCGEQYFKAPDLKKIEARFERISNGLAKPTRKILVPVDTFAV